MKLKAINACESSSFKNASIMATINHAQQKRRSSVITAIKAKPTFKATNLRDLMDIEVNVDEVENIINEDDSDEEVINDRAEFDSSQMSASESHQESKQLEIIPESDSDSEDERTKQLIDKKQNNPNF